MSEEKTEAPARSRVWLEELVRKRAMVMHIPSGVIGIAAEYFDGQDKKFVDEKGATLTAPIVVIEESEKRKHSFIGAPGAFTEMPESLALVYVSFGEQLNTLMASTMKFAASKGVEPNDAINIIASHLRSVVRAVTT